ncbi:MAG: hypothetical protein KTR18_14375 [Acidiferrobacterales bacterium]|nr:hypothetical protein [Acidiferrobacterales bacterium]
MNKRTGGEILIDALRINQIDTIFGVPGESYLFALDAIFGADASIRFITCRQEGGAAYMADAYASVTGKPGVCFVTRGPGATNATVGLHTAFQDSIPMILLIGQIPRGSMEREAFQEIDYRQMLGPVTKWVSQIDQAERLPEFINRAIRVATSGRPGPVALALPEDMLRDEVEAMDLPPAPSTTLTPAPDAISKLSDLLTGAEKPLLVLGGSSWSDEGRQAIHEFAEKQNVPVVTGFRRQSSFDNDHRCYAGSLVANSFAGLHEYLEETDLLVAVGSRLADMTSTRYTLINAPKPKQPFVHVLSEESELGRVLTPDLGICADLNAFALAAASLPETGGEERRQKTDALVATHRAGLELGPQNSPVDMGKIMSYLREKLPRDAIITNGAGNFADWPNKFYCYRAARTVLAPVSGSMGYGVPAAIAAKIAYPERTVVCFAGDGDFMMNGQELATAMQYKLNPIFLIVNNNSYGTIRMHQEKHFPERVSGTDLVNPDFSAFARAFGANGRVINNTEDFFPAFETALLSESASLLELRVGSNCMGPDKFLS